MKFITLLNRLFLLWIIMFTGIAWLFPGIFRGLAFLISPGLGVIMLGMGLTLTTEDFLNIFKRPLPVILGVSLQFLFMPLIAFILSLLLDLNMNLSAGFILLGACPGGTASNLITFLAGGNVALSVTMTTFSTLLSPLATPSLTALFASRWVEVPVASMFLSILLIIVLPVLAGLFVHTTFGQRVEKIKPLSQFLSVITIAFIIAVIVAMNRKELSGMLPVITAGVVLHNCLGLMAGYLIPRFFKIDKRDALTIAIEVGMQNSGLAVKLALDYFSAAAALPGALFSIWHNISGALLAIIRKSHIDKEGLE